MKLKQRRHLEASLQSTENPEPEPAIDCVAAPCGLCQAIQAPPGSCWHTRDGHHGPWSCKFSRDWLQRPGLHGLMQAEESHKGPEGVGAGVGVDVPSPFLLVFGRGVPYALFSKGLMTCSNPLAIPF